MQKDSLVPRAVRTIQYSAVRGSCTAREAKDVLSIRHMKEGDLLIL